MRNSKRLSFDDSVTVMELLEKQEACKVLGGYNTTPMNDEPIDGGWLDEVEIPAPGDDDGGGSPGPGNPGGDPGGPWSPPGPGDSGGGSGGGGGGAGNPGTSDPSYDEPQEPDFGDQPTEQEILNEAGYWSYVDGEFVWTVNGGTLQEVTISVSTGYTATDAIGVMLSSMGMAADHADVAAAIMKLETKGFTIASRGFGVVGALQNVYQMVEKGEWDWQDAGQIALGGVLLIPGLNGALVVAGGAVLFGWELYELLNE